MLITVVGITPTRLSTSLNNKSRIEIMTAETETKKVVYRFNSFVKIFFQDLLIYDLRKQVSELLRFKEQASNLRSQLNLMEEREKIRDVEHNNRIGNLSELLIVNI